MSKIEFAPDGEHYQPIKTGSLIKLWDYFVFNTEMRIQLALNPYAKFRLLGNEQNVIGVLPPIIC